MFTINRDSSFFFAFGEEDGEEEEESLTEVAREVAMEDGGGIEAVVE